MSKLLKSFSIIASLALGLSLGLATSSIASTSDQPSTNFVNLTPNWTQDLNIEPSFEPADYEYAYKVFSKQHDQSELKTQHIRFVGFTNYQYKTDMLFTIKDPELGSTLVFIAMPDDNPVLSLDNLVGDESTLLRDNIIECDSYNVPEEQINPCVWDNTIRF